MTGGFKWGWHCYKERNVNVICLYFEIGEIMKRNKLLSLVFFIVAVLSVCSLLSCCNTDTSNIKKKVDIEILNFSDATQEDFNRYNNAFIGSKPDMFVGNYKLIKMNCKIKNNNDYPISFELIKEIKNDDCYLPSNAADYEPTFSIRPNDSRNVDIYIYVNKNLTEDEISNTLNGLDIDLCEYEVN